MIKNMPPSDAQESANRLFQSYLLRSFSNSFCPNGFPACEVAEKRNNNVMIAFSTLII